MEEKYLILSDIHGNVSAFEAVLNDCKRDIFTGVVLLGDCIDYGMRSNEIIQKLIELENTQWKDKIIVNIWGNHEKLVVDRELEKLSSDRGRVMAKYTARNLSDSSIKYINESMNHCGIQNFLLCGFNCLAVHGSLEDHYWRAVKPGYVHSGYINYDLVFSGHSHYSHCFTGFYSIENADLRNKKAVAFINPGSVGQPRNQNPRAQYAVIYLPSKRVELRAAEYDVQYEQSLFPDVIDEFYKNRLTRGV